MRRVLVLLGLAVAAAADPHADQVAVGCMREYYATLRPGGGDLGSIRDRLLPVMRNLSPDVAVSVIRQLNKGFDKKYGKDTAYYRDLARILSEGGTLGIATLFRRYKAEGKRHELRQVIAESLGACGHDAAYDSLEKMIHDKEPPVAVAAVTALAAYTSADEKKRKETCKALVKLFGVVTDKAAGKEPETAEMKAYVALKPALNATLRAFTRQDLDSAAAWDAWLRENITHPWK